MTIWQALRQLALDVPNAAVAVTAALSAWVAATIIGADPDWLETIWFGLCVAGFFYHWSGVGELLVDRLALQSWPEVDAVDLESNADSLRQEQVRLAVKSMFSLAGLISMFVPPRVAPQYELSTQIIVLLLIGAVVALDVDAVLKRRSRRHQMDMLKASIESRRQRRHDLEERFQPAFERFAGETSRSARQLMHEVRNGMSLIASAIEVLKQSEGCTDDDRDMMVEAGAAADHVLVLVDGLHQLVRDLDREEFQDGSNDTAGPVQPPDEP
jgi:hypothetical protein